MYEIRDDKGVLKAKLSDSLGKELVMTARGNFKNINYVGGGSATAYILSEPRVLRMGDATIYFWENDRVVYKDVY